MKRFKTARVSFAIVFISIVVCLFFSVVGSYADDVKDTPLPVTEQIIGQDGDLTLLAGSPEVTLDYYEINIPVGGSYQLNATTNPANKFITWINGSLSIARVDNNGVVTGVSEGTTNIRASFSDDEGVYSALCVVNVGPATGIYRIKNVNSGYYLNVNGGSILSNTIAQQYSLYNNNTLNSQYVIRQLWRIGYIAERGGYYTVRPYHKSDMLLSYNNTNACIIDASYEESYAECTDGLWKIISDSGNLVFKYNDSNSCVMQVYNSSTSVGAVVKLRADTSTSSSRWTIETLAYPPVGVQLYTTSGSMLTSTATKYIALESVKSLSGFNMEVQAYGDFSLSDLEVYNSTIRYSSSSTSVATVTSSNGDVKGISEGNATISVELNLTSTNVKDTFIVRVTSVPEGTHFIQNRTTQKYLQIDDASTNTVGARMEQWSFDGADDQRWELTLLGDGYYKITSKKNGYALSIPAGSETVEDVALVQQSYTGAYRQQWKITKTANGSYKIKARSSESYTEKDLVMDIGTSSNYNADGIAVSQMRYVNNTSYRDEWYLTKLDYNTAINLLGITNQGHDHSLSLLLVDNDLKKSGFVNSNTVLGNISGEECLEMIQESQVFISRSHGIVIRDVINNSIISTGIQLNDDESNKIGLFSRVWWNGTSENRAIVLDDSFSDTKIIVFVGCNTATTGSTVSNLSEIAHHNGAQVVIGFTESIWCDEANIWTTLFYEALISGNTVGEAVVIASREFDEDTGLHSAEIYGNGNYRLVD